MCKTDNTAAAAADRGRVGVGVGVVGGWERESGRWRGR